MFNPKILTIMSDSKDRVAWAGFETEPGWKMKDGEVKSFESMTPAQLQKFYKLACHKELVYTNKLAVFEDKRREIEEEARKRQMDLKTLDTDFHRNEKVLGRK